MKSIAILFGIVLLFPIGITFAESEIPDWVRNIATWWGAGEVSDDEFINAINFLIEQNIIQIETQESKNIVEELIDVFDHKPKKHIFELLPDMEDARLAMINPTLIKLDSSNYVEGFVDGISSYHGLAAQVVIYRFDSSTKAKQDYEELNLYPNHFSRPELQMPAFSNDDDIASEIGAEKCKTTQITYDLSYINDTLCFLDNYEFVVRTRENYKEYKGINFAEKIVENIRN